MALKFSGYSIVTNVSPWITYCLSVREHKLLSNEKKALCVHLEIREQDVTKGLFSSRVSNNLLDTCDITDIIDWSEEADNRKLINEKLLRKSINGADYIESLWKATTNNSDVAEYQQLSIQQLFNMIGVFHFEMRNNYEVHAFVLYMTENTITVYNSYGGFVGFYVTKFEKDNWIESLISFEGLTKKQQAKNYHLLFGFTKEMVRGVTDQLHERHSVPISYKKLEYRKVF